MRNHSFHHRARGLIVCPAPMATKNQLEMFNHNHQAPPKASGKPPKTSEPPKPRARVFLKLRTSELLRRAIRFSADEAGRHGGGTAFGRGAKHKPVGIS